MLPNDNQTWDPTVRAYLEAQRKAQEEQDATNQGAMTQDMIGAGTDVASALFNRPTKQAVYLQNYNDTSAPKMTQVYQSKANGDSARQVADQMRAAGVAKKAADLKDAGTVAELEDKAHSRGLADNADARAQAGEGRAAEEHGWKADDQARKQAVLGAEDDPNSMNSQIARDLAGKLMPGSAKHFEGMSATQLAPTLKGMQSMYAAEQDKLWKQMQLQGMQQERQDKRSEKQQEAAEKQEQKNSMTNIDGFEHDDKVGVKPEQADKLRQSQAELAALKSEVKQYQSLVKRNGAHEWGGEEGIKMESLSTSIKMRLKNLYSLGALSSSDIDIMASQVPSPTSMGAIFAKGDTVNAGLDQLLKDRSKDVELKMKQNGYKQKTPSGFPRQVSNAETGETATVSDENELKEANQHGFN